MAKILLLSPIVMTIVLPTMAASRDSFEKGLTRAIGWWVVFSIGFMVALRYIYPRLL